MTPLELVAALLSALGVWLTIQRRLICWPVSLAAALLYGWVFLDARLYADAALQCVFCGCLLYGWAHWKYETTNSVPLRIRSASWKILASGMALGMWGAVLWGVVLKRWTDDPMPFTDAALSSFSIVAQLWAARRYTANWTLWIVIDTLYVALFVARDLYPTAILYSAFVLLALHGAYKWRKLEGTDLRLSQN